MKGIILAGGKGSRLFPATLPLSKQLLPVYDKPMIYYSLSVLMLADIRDILIITSPEHLALYQTLLGDGKDFGINLQYIIQEKPKGIAEAFILGEDFINGESVCLILGDNLFYGGSFVNSLHQAKQIEQSQGATVFAYRVNNPSEYGVVEFDKNNKAISIEEKPLQPKSSYAVTGLYFYDKEVCQIAKTIKPSARGELEITSINNIYLQKNQLQVEQLNRGIAWLDTGTYDNLLSASNYIQAIEQRQGLKIACLEEIAYHQNWINANTVKAKIKLLTGTQYGDYLQKILEEN